jgi:hypothetical protein
VTLTRQVATVPVELWSQLVLRVQAESEPGLVALMDQIVRETGVMTIEIKPVIPSSAAIPWQHPTTWKPEA